MDSASQTARAEHGEQTEPAAHARQPAPGEVGILQERARALEDEVEQRKALEVALRAALKDREGAEESLRRALADLQQAAVERADLLAREKLARRDAEAANRLKDDFLATLSHELRTPLNSILGWVHVLRTGQLAPEKEARALSTIERNAKLQAQLIDDVLDVSRIIAGKMSLHLRSLDLTGVVSAAVETVRPLAEARKVQLVVELDPDAGSVAGDSERLQQVCWNLLSNAIKFTPAGGRVTVRLDQSGSSARIRVADTGRGITAEFLPRVFDRFRQADTSSSRTHGGLGLGLSIVEQLVALHGGTVRADSEGEGKGAEFTVCLPVIALQFEDTKVKPPKPTSGIARKAPGDVASGEHEKILDGVRALLVEDDPDARSLMEMLMREEGADVRAVSTSREALVALQEWGPDVLVSDIGLPDEDGYQLLSKVRSLPIERGGSVPAIALTAFASAQDNRRAMMAGYQVHMPKPFEPERLLRIVAELTRWGENDGAAWKGSARRG
jgi:signal transduction histidine kinase/ActR/RegA family two-component response regulator